LKYQIIFRTARGGSGIEYEVAKAEFISVFGKYGLEIIRDIHGRHRLWVNLSLKPKRIPEIAQNLGYTLAILQIREEPYLGEQLSPKKTARWYLGWARFGDLKIHFSEVYVQDEEERLKASPHNRGFPIEKDGILIKAKGHKFHRGLSPLDAKFMLNIAQLSPDMRILDPFAGFGGIVFEAQRRRLNIVSSDVDASLSPGLKEVSVGRCTICDATHLPFPTAFFDAVVTEPSFRRIHRISTLNSLPEIRRVLKPHGVMVLLISEGMYDAVTAILKEIGGRLTSEYRLRRYGGLMCRVLRVDFANEKEENWWE